MSQKKEGRLTRRSLVKNAERESQRSRERSPPKGVTPEGEQDPKKKKIPLKRSPRPTKEEENS